jgi:hypothetical protein
MAAKGRTTYKNPTAIKPPKLGPSKNIINLPIYIYFLFFLQKKIAAKPPMAKIEPKTKGSKFLKAP